MMYLLNWACQLTVLQSLGISQGARGQRCEDRHRQLENVILGEVPAFR